MVKMYRMGGLPSVGPVPWSRLCENSDSYQDELLQIVSRYRRRKAWMTSIPSH